MLELTCCIGLSMNIAYFLEFECTLKCSRVECIATNIERMIIVSIIMCDIFDAISLLSQRLFDLSRKHLKLVNKLTYQLWVCPLGRCEHKAKNCHRCYLRSKGLGAGHTDLCPHVYIYSTVNFACNRAPHCINDTKARHTPSLELRQTS